MFSNWKIGQRLATAFAVTLGLVAVVAATGFWGLSRTVQTTYSILHTDAKLMEQAGQAASLVFGLPFSNYTGVLIGATAIPAWNENAGDLPMHFGMSGLSAAVGMPRRPAKRSRCQGRSWW